VVVAWTLRRTVRIAEASIPVQSLVARARGVAVASRCTAIEVTSALRLGLRIFVTSLERQVTRARSRPAARVTLTRIAARILRTDVRLLVVTTAARRITILVTQTSIAVERLVTRARGRVTATSGPAIVIASTHEAERDCVTGIVELIATASGLTDALLVATTLFRAIDQIAATRDITRTLHVRPSTLRITRTDVTRAIGVTHLGSVTFANLAAGGVTPCVRAQHPARFTCGMARLAVRRITLITRLPDRRIGRAVGRLRVAVVVHAITDVFDVLVRL